MLSDKDGDIRAHATKLAELRVALSCSICRPSALPPTSCERWAQSPRLPPAGQITVEEAQAFATVLEQQRRGIELVELETRIAALESRGGAA